jgi:hypothetical protein
VGQTSASCSADKKPFNCRRQQAGKLETAQQAFRIYLIKNQHGTAYSAYRHGTSASFILPQHRATALVCLREAYGTLVHFGSYDGGRSRRDHLAIGIW